MKAQGSRPEAQMTRPKVQPPVSGAGSGLWIWDFGFRKGSDLSRRAVLFLLLLMVMVWLVAGAYLVLVSQTMMAARRLQALRDEVVRLQKENALFERLLAEMQAVERLRQEAVKMGFAPAARLEFVEP